VPPPLTCLLQDDWVKYYLQVMSQTEEALVAGGDEPLVGIKGKIQAVAKWVLDGCQPGQPGDEKRAPSAEVEAGAEQQEGIEKAADGGQVSLKVADVQANWSTPVQDPHKQPHATHAPQCRAT
jgi:hypothetical protein